MGIRIVVANGPDTKPGNPRDWNYTNPNQMIYGGSDEVLSNLGPGGISMGVAGGVPLNDELIDVTFARLQKYLRDNREWLEYDYMVDSSSNTDLKIYAEGTDSYHKIEPYKNNSLTYGNTYDRIQLGFKFGIVASRDPTNIWGMQPGTMDAQITRMRELFREYSNGRRPPQTFVGGGE